MPHNAFDLASNVSHALDIFPPNYVRSILGDPPSWFRVTCPHTELQLAEFTQLPHGLLSLAHILVPALASKSPVNLPFVDFFFRPSTVFEYPLGPLAHARGSEGQNDGPEALNGTAPLFRDGWAGLSRGASEALDRSPDRKGGSSRGGSEGPSRSASEALRRSGSEALRRSAPEGLSRGGSEGLRWRALEALHRNPDREGGDSPTPEQAWFFINGIGTDRSVVLLNAAYLYELFGRPLTVLHNFTRGVAADLLASAVGKESDQVTESAAVAFPPIHAALKSPAVERVIVIGHSQGTILSAVVLHLLKGLHPTLHRKWVSGPPVAPEHSVARRLAQRWNFAGSLRTGKWPEPVSFDELRKLELYCFANCASHMTEVQIAGKAAPGWIESYGNEKDIVARLGVLAPARGPGSVHISGDRYERVGAWGHLLNAHYLCPIMKARDRGNPAGGLTAGHGNVSVVPRLFAYLNRQSPP